MATASTSVPARKAPPSIRIVGLGASAGGLRALKEFFAALPEAPTGLAFVVVVHRASEATSGLPGLIGSYTAMPVVEVTARVPVEPGHVYLIPQGQHLAAADGHLEPRPFDTPEERRFALDTFFRTHAEAHGDGVAVVLSGAGTDGSVGIKLVKEAGGLVFAQDPTEADHASMPRAAIETGAVDFVLPVAEIARHVVRLADASPLPAEPKALADPEADALQKVLSQLRVRTGHDFSAYKPATVLRRIARRMQAQGVARLGDYLERLRVSGEEAQALFSDLLISVTTFFRDRAAFEALEKHVLPKLFEGRTPGEPLRVWSVGCATGEEAYSLAMLLLEGAERAGMGPELQVFASDLSEEALELAREGLYPEAIEADVTEDRLRRFFVKEDHHYRIRAEVRQQVLFAPHSLLREPPFSRLDLIVCRNLLIYLNRDLQERVFELFHYALRPGGFLFLGSAENAETAKELFRPVQKKHRLYVRRDTVASAPVLPSLPLLRVDALVRRPGGHVEGQRGAPSASSPARLHAAMLEAHATPSVLVDEHYEVLHLSHDAGRFLVHPAGPPTTNLLRLVRDELRIELRAALHEAFEHERPAASRLIAVRFDGSVHGVHFIVRPGPEPGTGRPLALVLFLDVEVPPDVLPALAYETDPAVRHLEAEMARMRERQRMMIEEYETSTEELKAANEELQSINEEYKSALEELETSKEELQSVNEELHTVNFELKGKVDELSTANADLQNLMASTEIGTLFLDRRLRIKRFTPPLQALFNVITADRGRPIAHVTHRLRYPTLADDAERVIDRLVTVTREVQREDGRWYIATIRPYRTATDAIDGVVITFVDETDRKQTGETLREREEQAEAVFEHVREYAIFTLDPARRVTGWNAGAARILGFTEDEILGQTADLIFTDEDRAVGAPEQEAMQAAATGQAADERWHQRKDRSRFWANGMMTALRHPDGSVRGFVKILRDETARRMAEAALRESETRLRRSEQQLRLAVESARMGLWTWDVAADVFTRLHFHPSLLKPGDDKPGPLAGFLARIHFDDRARVERAFKAALAGQKRLEVEYRVSQRDGRTCWMACVGEVVRDDAGAPAHVYGLLYDVTDRHEAEARLRTLNEHLEGRVAEGTEQVRTLASTLTLAEQQERQRLAAVLHDHLQQVLYGLQAHLKLLGRTLKGPSPASDVHTERMRKLLDEAIAATRSLTAELSPPVLADPSLATLLDWLATRMQELHGLHVAVEGAEVVRVAADEVRVLLFQLVRELLFNVVKHGSVTQARVEVQASDDEIVVVVADEGRGFDVKRAERAGRRQEGGFGLFTIRERLALLGGRMTIESTPSVGTRITVAVPLFTRADDAR